MKKDYSSILIILGIFVLLLAVNDRGRAEEERKFAAANNPQKTVVQETVISESTPAKEDAVQALDSIIEVSAEEAEETVQALDSNTEVSATEPDPYSKEWFTHVLYSAKLSHTDNTWTVFLTVGSTDGKILVQARFKDKDSASGLGDLIYQKASEYSDETLVLYATAFLGEQMLYFELAADRAMPEAQE